MRPALFAQANYDNDHDPDLDHDHDYDNMNNMNDKPSLTRTVPKFDHISPLNFFVTFISFCQAHRCGEPLTSDSGKIDDIQTLDDRGYADALNAQTPTREEVAQRTPQRTRGRGRGRPPDEGEDAALNDRAYATAVQEARRAREDARATGERARQIAGYLREAVDGDALGEAVVEDVIGETGIDGPKAFKQLYLKFGPKSQGTFTNLEFAQFRQNGTSLNKFLSILNKFFKWKAQAGEVLNDRSKCDAICERIDEPLLEIAHNACTAHKHQWPAVVEHLMAVTNSSARGHAEVQVYEPRQRHGHSIPC